MKLYLLTILILITSISWGQKETLVFKISKPKSEVVLQTADTIFYTTNVNYFSVETTGKDKISFVSVANGKLSTIAAGLYAVRFTEEGNTIIKVLTKSPTGEVRQALAQTMFVKGQPKPVLRMCGVPKDSALNKEHLIKDLTLKAFIPKLDMHAPVLGYQLILKKDTIQISGNKIPITVKPKLYNLKEGDVLKIRNVQVQTSTTQRQIYTVKRFNLFIVETDQYTTGKRKYIER